MDSINERNLEYQQINWGWLNDYSGYKFAPITFFDKIYTETGAVFSVEYRDFLNKLRNGGFLVKDAQRLSYMDEGVIKPYGQDDPHPEKPVYFSNGIPVQCPGPIEIDLVGNVNNIDNYSGYTIKAGTIYGDTIENDVLNGNTINSNTINSSIIVSNTKVQSPIFEGLNGNAAHFVGNADTATKLNGVTVGYEHLPVYFEDGEPKPCNRPTCGTNWLGIPFVGVSASEEPEGGIMEIGKYIDFHSFIAQAPGDYDYSTRLYCTNTHVDDNGCGVQLALPTESGKIALVTDTTPVKIIKTTDTATRKYFTTVTGEGSNDNLYYYEAIYAETDPDDNLPVLMGAAWNDYAEYRNQVEIIEAGYCVCSNDDGLVSKTTEKLQACDGIVSDTFGFAIGKTDKYKTPLAVAGRVLAYCTGNREDYHSGDTVCAGPEGKVCKMTREEIKEYPDRIVGTVSEIPQYEEWSGKKVNNRIWIKIK